MIVDRHRAHAMLTGRIHEYRIPWRPTRTEPLNEPTMLAVKGRTGKRRKRSYSQQLPKPGHDIAIRTEMFGDTAGHIQIITCTLARQHADTLTADHLKALGHPDADTYIDQWILERDTAWLARRAPTDQTYATTDDQAHTALCCDDPDSTIRTAIEQRWLDRWATRPVYIVTFQPSLDRDYYLAGPPRVKFATRHDGRHVVDDGIRDQDRGYSGDGVRPVPTTTELEDRGITDRPANALTDAGRWEDTAGLTLGWTNAANQRHTNARSRKHRVNDRAKRARAA